MRIILIDKENVEIEVEEEEEEDTESGICAKLS